MPEFSGRRIVVTGASSGIGRACAVELSRLGANLVLIGRNSDTLAETESMLDRGIECTLIQADLFQLTELDSLISPTLQQLAPIYGTCQAAGNLGLNPLRTATPRSLQELMSLNFHAFVEIIRLSTKRKVADGAEGAHVGIASVAAHVGSPGQVGYCASKAAMLAASRAMALELAPRNIRVNTVSPGFVRTPMNESGKSRMIAAQVDRVIEHHPLGAGEPVQVANAVVYLLDPANNWITGSDLVVDGGYSAH